MTSKNYSPAHNCLKLLSLAAYDSASRFSQEQIRTQSILCKEFIWESLGNIPKEVEKYSRDEKAGIKGATIKSAVLVGTGA